MSEKRRIGVMGGTFNPIHMGHLMIAEFSRDAFCLDKVIFVPANNPPHKHSHVIDAGHRYKMTELAIASNPYFCISDIELKRPGNSYTIDTIQELREQYGESYDYYFICGTDTIQDLPSWKYIDQLLSICHFIGATRPDGSDGIDNIKRYFGTLGETHIHRLVVPLLEISATNLRERIYQDKTVRYIMPENVRKYIEENKIYKK